MFTAEKAEAIFRLLIDCFGEYADGYNYLGLIAYQQRKLDQAVAHFVPPASPRNGIGATTIRGPICAAFRTWP